MAGEKGKRKRSSSSAPAAAPAQEHRGGEESAPKIRKVAQEDTGKREGKLQVKGKMRRLEEKGEEVAAIAPRDAVIVEAPADDPARRNTEEKDCDHSMMFPEYAEPQFLGIDAQLEEVNAAVSTSAMEFIKERADTRLEEFEGLDQGNKADAQPMDDDAPAPAPSSSDEPALSLPKIPTCKVTMN